MKLFYGIQDQKHKLRNKNYKLYEISSPISVISPEERIFQKENLSFAIHVKPDCNNISSTQYQISTRT